MRQHQICFCLWICFCFGTRHDTKRARKDCEITVACKKIPHSTDAVTVGIPSQLSGLWKMPLACGRLQFRLSTFQTSIVALCYVNPLSLTPRPLSLEASSESTNARLLLIVLRGGVWSFPRSSISRRPPPSRILTILLLNYPGLRFFSVRGTCSGTFRTSVVFHASRAQQQGIVVGVHAETPTLCQQARYDDGEAAKPSRTTAGHPVRAICIVLPGRLCLAQTSAILEKSTLLAGSRLAVPDLLRETAPLDKQHQRKRSGVTHNNFIRSA